MRERFDSLFAMYADANVQDWLHVKAQGIAESNLDPSAQSPVGAQGVMQFMPATWREWGDGGDPFNPAASIRAGCRYRRWLYQHVTRSTTDAEMLAAYNWGIGHVKRHLRDHGGSLQMDSLPAETRQYIERVTRLYAEIGGTA